MPKLVSKEIRLKARPLGLPQQSDFELAETEVPQPEEGQFLVRNIWMSVDPYMRGRMINQESYVPPFQLGEPLQGSAIGQVVASQHSRFAVGDYVSSFLGWREYFLSNGEGVRQVDRSLGPLEAQLGALGMTGLTAYVGLFRIGKLADGEQVFVSAAAGAVGSVVCQLAKAHGCYVVGSAGSAAKCEWLEEQAGIDRAINYKGCGSLSRAVRRAFPQGIDLYFENVGGAHLQAALGSMNPLGRIVLCGMISQYNNTEPEPGPNNLILAISKSLRLQGFIVSDHLDLAPRFQEEMKRLIAERRMKWKETVEEGIENAPRAFLKLFSGENFGKMLVRIGPDPAS